MLSSEASRTVPFISLVLHVYSMGTWSFPDTRTLNALFRHCNTQSKIDSRFCGQYLLDQYAPF